MQSFLVQMSSLVRPLRVFQRMAQEQPVTLPEAKPVKTDPCIVNPTEVLGPDNYVDLGAYSPNKKRKLRRQKSAQSIQEES